MDPPPRVLPLSCFPHSLQPSPTTRRPLACGSLSLLREGRRGATFPSRSTRGRSGRYGVGAGGLRRTRARRARRTPWGDPRRRGESAEAASVRVRAPARARGGAGEARPSRGMSPDIARYRGREGGWRGGRDSEREEVPPRDGPQSQTVNLRRTANTTHRSHTYAVPTTVRTSADPLRRLDRYSVHHLTREKSRSYTSTPRRCCRSRRP